MFTGIVTAVGRISEVTETQRDRRLYIKPGAGTVELGSCRDGDSISVSGVCLTMLQPSDDGFYADVSAETLALTTLANKSVGDKVNLELAMRAGDRFGGHMVSGHVDSAIRLLSRTPDGQAERLDFELPVELRRYLSRKGSVCLDGVSLTVNSVSDDSFSTCIIPHTLAVTSLGALAEGDFVNLEVDMIARYLESLALDKS
ncbi:MAG TPA: riboflavin synthase [Xanthomonadales bacterium]|nr:riboflavin synthase [Xanthomonadales bacterium]